MNKVSGEKYENLYQDIVSVLKKYQDTIPIDEQICLLAKMQGKMLTGITPGKYSNKQILDAILENIVKGNQEFVKDLEMMGVIHGTGTPGTTQ